MVKGKLTATGNLAWNSGMVRKILHNEKYVGDVLLQKTYTVDCITHKKAVNHGERTMYLVSDHHEPIVDRITYNLVQQELARRKSKRKVTSSGVSEQGKYSSKYALTELLVCGECGIPYRRVVWTQTGVKRPVWRCVSRLEHGSKYCKNSPTIHEEQLHRAIVKAINEFYDCGDDVAGILKSNVESALSGLEQNEIRIIQNRLNDIDAARNDLIGLITNGVCDEDKLDSEFAKLYDEEKRLNEKLHLLLEQNNMENITQSKIKNIFSEIESEKLELKEFDDVLIRKLIECVKVISKTEIIIIFKGGYEVKAEVDKK